MADIYEKEPIVIKTDRCIAKVYRPILTEEERATRTKRLEKAAADLIKAAIDAGRYMAI